MGVDGGLRELGRELKNMDRFTYSFLGSCESDDIGTGVEVSICTSFWESTDKLEAGGRPRIPFLNQMIN